MLKGRFIILPNLNDSGRHTLLRAGNGEQYRKMPCVGGYVDGSIAQHGIGNQRIVSGQAREYGFKCVALFQTSDNRRIDFRDLGTHTTWVKWSVPTAEAIRQACLAKESRISQTIPDLPQTYITKLDVTNSKYFGSFSLDFNNQYNAIIGGRGTGKSTILEYLRWGLCDQPIFIYPEHDSVQLDMRRHSLIEKTLVPYDGEVRIFMSLNGITHIVKRSSKSKEILLKIGDGEFSLVSEEEIRRILPIQAYSQKQLSSVGVLIDELKRFVELPIATDLSNLKSMIKNNAKKIIATYNNIIRKREIKLEIEQYTLDIKSLKTQVENVRKSLTGLSANDQATIAQKEKIENEKTIISQIEAETLNISERIIELFEFVDNHNATVLEDVIIHNEHLMRQIESARDKMFKELTSRIDELKNYILKDGLAELTLLVSQWRRSLEIFDEQYSSAKSKAISNQKQLSEIERIEERLRHTTKSLGEKKLHLGELGTPEE
jgi:chromosome segregation protein